MDTFFASPERADNDLLKKQIMLTSNNPIIDNVMSSISGLLAVLNENRQIVSINKTLMETLGIEKAEDVFGMRPGEAVNCIHSKEMPGGCGTSKHCRTCGAVISIVSSLELNKPVEEKCIISSSSDTGITEHMFSVRANSITVSGHKFVLFFLREITEDEWRIVLEKIFYHDINNVVHSLNMAVELASDEMMLPESIQMLVDQLSTEIELQQILTHGRKHDYSPKLRVIELTALLNEIQSILKYSSVLQKKDLIINNSPGSMKFNSVAIIIKRIIINMIINALEASDDGDEVRLSVELENDNIVFKVFNKQEIPTDISLRIFQHQISGKKGEGRGIGTYSMKILGEDILKGKVGFTTSKQDGTEFYFSLPLTA